MAYKVNKSYRLSGSQGDGRVATRWYVIAHESGNQNDVNDRNAVLHEVQYMKSHYEAAYTTHFVGGGGRIYEIGTPGYVSWGALNANPYAVAQVELARTKDAATFRKDYAAYVWILRSMAKKYGIPTTLDTGTRGTRGIKSHRWCTEHHGGDHTDPYDYLALWGITKSRFAHDLAYGLGNITTKHKVKKVTRKSYNSKDYFQYNPIKVKVLTDINAYSRPTFGKQKSNKAIKKGTVLHVLDVKKYATVTRLKTKFGWVSGRKDLVTNLYYFTASIKKSKVIGKGVHGYAEPELKCSVTPIKDGVYTVHKIFRRKSGLPVAQLKSGLFVSTRKDSVKKVA